MKRDYKTEKICTRCGKKHVEYSKFGNPYEMCPVCRKIAYNKAVEEAKEIKNETERSIAEKRGFRYCVR